MAYSLGSLFDGSGGFPLAGHLCGIEPKWASEVEPYPIAVTHSRFPTMKHLGDISKINGGEIEPVDIITFGSPCQDLSVAGKRAGLKHESNGDEETTRSGLFMEAVRIIKEMRSATNGKYPTFALWENVPGAFSSNKGEDFRIVLEELIKIVEPTAVMPPVPQNGWPYADSYCGEGWSIAYRVLDAQYWGVPQRRRRIYLVADFRDQRAREISFEREGLRGYFETGRTPWQEIAGNAESGIGTADCTGEGITYALDQQGGKGGANYAEEVMPTLCSDSHGTPHAVAYSFDSLASNSMKSSNPHSGCRQVEVSKCLDTTNPDPSKNQGGIAIVEPIPYTPKIRSGVAVDSAGKAAGKGALIQTNKAATLAATQDQYLFQPVVYESHPMDSRIKELEDGISPTVAVKWHKGAADTPLVCEQHLFENHGQDSRYRGPLDVCPMLPAQLGTGGNNQPFVVEGSPVDRPAVAFTMQGFGDYKDCEVGSGLKARDYKDATDLVTEINTAEAVRYIVRRLTPTECARLQGFPDEWGHPDIKDDLTDEEYRFWLEVRNTHAEINGKTIKDYTKEQMLTWYNKLHTDSNEYKMWGNGIALPCALYIMQGIAEELRKGE